MPRFRLSYPAHIYATIDADALTDAKAKFKDILEDWQDGISIDLSIDQDGDPIEVAYPDSDKTGNISVKKMALEDEEDDPEDDEEE